MSRTVTFTCERCGAEATKEARGKPYRFCSRYCGVRGRGGPTQKVDRERECRQCGGKITENKLERFCSIACRALAQKVYYLGARNPNYSNAGMRTCEGCGASYYSYQPTRRFCSALCSHVESKDHGMANYRRGYDAELKAFEFFVNAGYIVFRSAASKGPFDLIAIGDGGTYFLQIKRTKDISRRRHTATVRELQALKISGEQQCVQVWVWVDYNGWFVIDLADPSSPREFWLADEPNGYLEGKRFPPAQETQQWLALDRAIDAAKAA